MPDTSHLTLARFLYIEYALFIIHFILTIPIKFCILLQKTEREDI